MFTKTEYMLIGSRQRLAKLHFEPGRYVLRVIRKKVKDNKILLVYIDESLMWSKHIEEITKKITAGISALKRLGDFVSRDVLVSVIVSNYVSVYNAPIIPHFDYCC